MLSPAGGVGQSTPTGWSPGGVHAGAQNLPTGRRVRVAESNRKPGDWAVSCLAKQWQALWACVWPGLPWAYLYPFMQFGHSGVEPPQCV